MHVLVNLKVLMRFQNEFVRWFRMILNYPGLSCISSDFNTIPEQLKDSTLQISVVSDAYTFGFVSAANKAYDFSLLESDDEITKLFTVDP